MDWLPWQKRIIRAVLETPLTCLSTPRGQGKSTLAAGLIAECLTPGSRFHRPDSEAIIVAGSVAQARRTTWGLLRPLLRALPNVRIHDTPQDCHALHQPSGARVAVMASNSDRALGLVGCPLVIGDEPASWGINGEHLFDAVSGALGKPGPPMRFFMVGTQSPHRDTDWWPELCASGDGADRRVFLYQTDPEKWHDTRELQKANPLKWAFPDTRARLLRERDEALASPAKAGSFMRWKANLPGGDPQTELLSPASWAAVLAREPAAADGRPTCGIDLGTAPSWSAAVPVWPSGRMDALGLAPGLPGLDAQERRDRAPRGLYERLVASGALLVAHDRRAPTVRQLVDEVWRRWQPRVIVADRVRANELRDAVAGRCRVVLRIARWSEASEDIGSFRRWSMDGGGTVAPGARALLTYSIGAARIRQNDGGDLARLDKRGGAASMRRRDDVAAASIFAAGAAERGTERAIRLVV